MSAETRPCGEAEEREARTEASEASARASGSAQFISLVYASGVDERQFFTEKPEQRPASFQCPRCRRTNDYTIRWMRRTKRKDRQPQGGEDRAKFDKLRDHLLRLDDEVTCKTCGKKFEIPSQQSMVFVDQLAGLPNDEDLDREIAAASGEPEPEPEKKPKLPDRFTRTPSGWK